MHRSSLLATNQTIFSSSPPYRNLEACDQVLNVHNCACNVTVSSTAGEFRGSRGLACPSELVREPHRAEVGITPTGLVQESPRKEVRIGDVKQEVLRGLPGILDAGLKADITVVDRLTVGDRRRRDDRRGHQKPARAVQTVPP